jgi:ketosteroid isomerase-like protein
MLALGALLALSLTACQKAPPAAPAVDTAAIAQTIQADIQQLVGEFNARDAVSAVKHDAPDYVGMFHGLPNVKGPEEDLALTTQQVADPALNLTVSNETVDVAASGDMAVFMSNYTMVYTDPATQQPATENGNWVVGYKVQPDGSWKMAWGVVSDIGPAPAAAPAAADAAAAAAPAGPAAPATN